MMDMNGMMDRCMEAMSSMMGGGMMGNGIILVLLLQRNAMSSTSRRLTSPSANASLVAV